MDSRQVAERVGRALWLKLAAGASQDKVKRLRDDLLKRIEKAASKAASDAAQTAPAASRAEGRSVNDAAAAVAKEQQPQAEPSAPSRKRPLQPQADGSEDVKQ